MSAIPSRERVLIVEDNPDFSELVAGRLRGWGYEVSTAADGEEGLQAAEAQLPDLILLDILMPKMKGREVCARLKANPSTASIPVMFLTALGLPDHIEAGMSLGAEDYLVKPFRAETLRNRIKICLARHQRQPSAAALRPASHR